jgi:hypothetical protein
MQLELARLGLAAGMFVLLAACENIQGMTETLTTTGPVTPATPPTQIAAVVDNAGNATCTVTSPRQDQFGLFQIAYSCAWVQANRVALGTMPPSNGGAQNGYKVMLREGLGLVRGNCNDFFRKRGDNQQVINLSRDIVAIGGTTAAAIIGLAGGGSILALSIIALSGATLYSGIDTYTKNFLFGVENIESVRTLTMQTLSDNAATLLAQADATDKLVFQDISDAIMDNQEICKPASIAAAVRIKLRGGSGGIEAAETSNANALSDRAVMAKISELVGLPVNVIVSDTQLAALCWATTADGAKNLSTIQQLLVPFRSFGRGPGTADWEQKGVGVMVGAQCERLSSAARAVVNAKIKEFRGTQGGGTGALESISGAPGAGSIGRAGISGASSGGSGLRFVPMTVR